MKCLGGPGGWGGCGREEGLQGVSLPPSASLGGRVSGTEGQTRPPAPRARLLHSAPSALAKGMKRPGEGRGSESAASPPAPALGDD